MFKNTISQKIQFYAFDSTTNAPKTGDAANITAYVSIDGGAVMVLGDTSASELSSTNAKGSYQFDLTQAETNGNTLFFSAKSSTANVALLPVLLQTFPTAFGVVAGAAGGLLIAGSNAATTFATLTSTGAFTSGSLSSGVISVTSLTISSGMVVNSLTVSTTLLISGTSTFTGKALYSNGVELAAPISANTPALKLTGNGSGPGLLLVGGATGAGLRCESEVAAIQIDGLTNGFGMTLQGGSVSGSGLAIIGGGDSDAIYILGTGLGNGIRSEGGANGAGAYIKGGGTDGAGFLIEATGALAPSIQIISSGTGEGVNLISNGFGILIDSPIQFSSTMNVAGALLATSGSNDFRLGATERVNIATAVWNFFTSAMTLAGSIGKALVQTIVGTGGTYNVTITVKDTLGNLLQNARYAGYDNGGNLLFTGFTNASGQLTGSYPAGNVQVALIKTNYTFGGTTRTVTGLNAGTLTNDLVMSIVTPIVPPVDPIMQTIFGTLYGLDGPAVNQDVTFELVPVDNARPLTVNGNVVAFSKITVQTDALGAFSVDLPQTILMDDPAFYHIVCSSAQIDLEGVSLGSSPVDIADL